MFAMIQNDLMTHLLWVCLFPNSRVLEKRVYQLPLLLRASLHHFYAKDMLYPGETGMDGWMMLSNPLNTLSTMSLVDL